MEPVSTADVLSGAVFSLGGGQRPTGNRRVGLRTPPTKGVRGAGSRRDETIVGRRSIVDVVKPFATEAPLHSADAENALVL